VNTSPRSSRPFPAAWQWAAVVAAGSLAPCLAVLLAGRTLSWRDTSTLFEPMRPLIAESLRRFQLPLWNPYEGAGLPLFAQILHGVLHPWSILAAVLAPDSGIDLMIVLHVLTGALGAGMLARSLGASSGGAAVAGLGYGLSGYVLGLSAVIQYLAAAGAAPWTIWALRRAGRGDWVPVAIAGFLFAIQFFAGDPQWALVAAVLGVMLAIEQRGPRGGLMAAAAVALGGMLAAVQLLPGWSMLGETSRSAGLSAADTTQWAFHPVRLFELVVPGLFAGRPGPTPAAVFLWLDNRSAYPLPFLQSVFVGLPVLLCAAWGVGASRAARWCGVAAGVPLWMAFGHRLLAAQASSWVPIWSSFRYTEKLVGPFTLLVAVVAGLGLTRFATRGVDRGHRIAWPTAAVLAALAVTALAAGRTLAGPESWPAGIWPLIASRLAGGFALAGVAMAVLAVTAARRRDSGNQTLARERWVIALVLATGLLASPTALHAGRRDARIRQPLAELRRAATVPRVIQPVDQIALPVALGFDMFDAAQLVRSGVGRPAYNVPAGIDSFVTYTGLLPRRYGALLARLTDQGPASWVAFRRFAVTHVAITPPLTNVDAANAEAAIAGGFEMEHDPNGAVRVFQVPHTPWARFVTSVRTAGSEREAIELTAAAATSGDTAVVLEGIAPPVLTAGSILSIERGPGRVLIVAEAPAEGLLVVADSWWPGWRARIDGRPTPILRADAIVRAVVWPAGRHTLVMTYEPREVTVGAVLTGAAALLLAGMVIAGRRSSPRSR
jgi:hypothetical protein